MARTDTMTRAPARKRDVSSRGAARLALRTVGVCFSGAVEGREVLQQAVAIGWRSWPFVVLTVGVMGMVGVFQVASQAERILPEYAMIGAAFVELMVRELGPVVTGLMLATRVGSAMAAQLGTMAVTGQVDALRMCNAEPVRFLVAPRFLAATLMNVALTIFASAGALLAGAYVAASGWGVAPGSFLTFQLVSGEDIAVGLVKAVAFGMAIPVLAAHSGLAARGGAAGVGRATTLAVVRASFAVIVLDFLIGGAAYVLGR